MHRRPRIGLAVICLMAVVSIAAGPATQPARSIDRLIAELRSSEGKPDIKVAFDAKARKGRPGTTRVKQADVGRKLRVTSGLLTLAVP